MTLRLQSTTPASPGSAWRGATHWSVSPSPRGPQRPVPTRAAKALGKGTRELLPTRSGAPGTVPASRRGSRCCWRILTRYLKRHPCARRGHFQSEPPAGRSRPSSQTDSTASAQKSPASALVQGQTITDQTHQAADPCRSHWRDPDVDYVWLGHHTEGRVWLQHWAS